MKLWSHEGFKVCIWKCPTKLGENLKKGSSQIKLARVKLNGLVTLEAGYLNPFRYPTHDFKSFLGRGEQDMTRNDPKRLWHRYSIVFKIGSKAKSIAYHYRQTFWIGIAFMFLFKTHVNCVYIQTMYLIKYFTKYCSPGIWLMNWIEIWNHERAHPWISSASWWLFLFFFSAFLQTKLLLLACFFSGSRQSAILA